MTTVVSVAQGGTGANSAALARTALGVPPSAAYDQANTARDQANTARTQANSAYAQANSAYSDANTRLSASGGTLAGDLIITGNLTVSGNSTTLNAEILTIEDADVVLLSNVASTPALNAGIIVNRGTSTNTFLRWDEVTDKWGWSDDGSTTYKFTSALDAYAQANAAYSDANTRVLKAGDTMTGQLNISAGGLLVTGNVGVGMANPTHKLSVYGTVSETNPVFGLLSGKGSTTFNNGAQIAFGYNGSAQYMHFVHTRHNSSPANNSIDFYVSNGTQFNSLTSGSTHVMSLNGGNVGIGTTSPGSRLHILDSSGPVVRMVRTSNRFDIEADNNAMGLVSRDSATANAYFSGFTGVGIGTTSPSGLWSGDERVLHLSSSGGTAAGIRISSVNATAEFFSSAGSIEWGLYSNTASPFTIYTNGSHRFRITSDGNVGVGTTSPGAKLHVSGGGIRIPANTWIDSENSVNLIRDGRFGYSDSYRVVQIGINSSTSRAISLGYDPSVNPSGGFSGYEIIIPNNRAIIAPTSDNSTFVGVLRIDTSNNICIGGGNYQTTGHIFVNNSTGNVSIGTGTAGEKLSVNGAIESLVDAAGGASEGGQIVLRAPSGGNTRWNMDNYTNKFRIFREDDSNKANGAAYLHIINGGNVGIGTDNPTAPLFVQHTNLPGEPYSGIIIKNTDTTGAAYTGVTADGVLQSHYRFAINGSTKWQWRCGAGSGLDDLRAYSFTLNDDVMTVNNSGQIKFKYQPRFYAYGNVGGTHASGSFVRYGYTYVNVGSHYSSTNGRFTAPVTGDYYLFWGSIAAATSDVYRFYLYKNGADTGVQLRIDTNATGSEYGTNGSRAIILNLAQNDYVQIYYTADAGTSFYPAGDESSPAFTHFGGYLLG